MGLQCARPAFISTDKDVSPTTIVITPRILPDFHTVTNGRDLVIIYDYIIYDFLMHHIIWQMLFSKVTDTFSSHRDIENNLRIAGPL